MSGLGSLESQDELSGEETVAVAQMTIGALVTPIKEADKNTSNKEPQPNHLTPANMPVRLKITELNYYLKIFFMLQHKLLYSDEDCAICLNPLDNFEPTIITRCKVRHSFMLTSYANILSLQCTPQHTFHRACLLQSKSLCKSECPLCRYICPKSRLKICPTLYRYLNSDNFRKKLTPPSNRSLKPGSCQPDSNQDDNNLTMTSDLSSRTAIAAAARRGRNAVRFASNGYNKYLLYILLMVCDLLLLGRLCKGDKHCLITPIRRYYQ